MQIYGFSYFTGTTNSVRMNALQRGRITIGVRLGGKSLGIKPVRMNALQRGRITIGVRLGEKSLGMRMNALQRGRITIGARLGEKSLGIIAASSQHSTPLYKEPVLDTSVLDPVTFSAVPKSGVLSRKTGKVPVTGGITAVAL